MNSNTISEAMKGVSPRSLANHALEWCSSMTFPQSQQNQENPYNFLSKPNGFVTLPSSPLFTWNATDQIPGSQELLSKQKLSL